MTNDKLLKTLESSLIVSCQAPVDSPLHDPMAIAAMAKACVNQGAAGVRIDTPAHVREVGRQIPHIPMVGLWKQQGLDSEVYITPRFEDAAAIAQAGADIIAMDATLRKRPEGETVAGIISRIHEELGKLVMADVDNIESAIAAADAGADLVATTLYGYTAQTQHLSPPGYSLLTQLVKQLDIPAICEGGIASPQQARKALELGAYAVVVGTAITGIDRKVKDFQAVFDSSRSDQS
ncbi:MAG: N-acetylmannosamine-6-phosphate 2-epimerase [Xenococcaceae cyanobacterium]